MLLRRASTRTLHCGELWADNNAPHKHVSPLTLSWSLPQPSSVQPILRPSSHRNCGTASAPISLDASTVRRCASSKSGFSTTTPRTPFQWESSTTTNPSAPRVSRSARACPRVAVATRSTRGQRVSTNHLIPNLHIPNRVPTVQTSSETSRNGSLSQVKRIPPAVALCGRETWETL